MARPLSGLPQTKPAAVRIAPEELAKVRELATGIDASVSEVLRALVIGGLTAFTVYGIKTWIDAEHARHAAALEAARKARNGGNVIARKTAKPQKAAAA